MLFKKQFLAYWKDGGGDREKWGGWYVYAKRNKLGWSQPKLQLLLLAKILSPLSDIDVELEEICSRQVGLSTKVRLTLL